MKSCEMIVEVAPFSQLMYDGILARQEVMASEDFADKKFFELEDMRNILTGSVPPVLLSILARSDSHQRGRCEMHITS